MDTLAAIDFTSDIMEDFEIYLDSNNEITKRVNFFVKRAAHNICFQYKLTSDLNQVLDYEYEVYKECSTDVYDVIANELFKEQNCSEILLDILDYFDIERYVYHTTALLLEKGLIN